VTKPAQGKSLLRFGVFEADLRSGELRRNGHSLRLQEKPFQLLAILLETPGEVVSKEELQKRLWPDVTVDADAGLGEAVYKLRQALGDSVQAPRYIETVPKRGYRLVAAVEGPLEPAPPERQSRLSLYACAALGAALLVVGSLATDSCRRRKLRPVN
jgi:DNA-binding winged helix-turn-helix (wHTH) protein